MSSSDLLEEALAIHQALGDERSTARMHSRLARDLCTHPQVLDLPRALAHGRAAEAILAREPPGLSFAAVQTALATVGWQMGDSALGLESSQRAVEIASALAHEPTWANAAALRGGNLCESGRYAEGFELLERAWETADRLNLEVVAWFASALISVFAGQLGDFCCASACFTWCGERSRVTCSERIDSQAR